MAAHGKQELNLICHKLTRCYRALSHSCNSEIWNSSMYLVRMQEAMSRPNSASESNENLQFQNIRHMKFTTSSEIQMSGRHRQNPPKLVESWNTIHIATLMHILSRIFSYSRGIIANRIMLEIDKPLWYFSWVNEILLCMEQEYNL